MRLPGQRQRGAIARGTAGSRDFLFTVFPLHPKTHGCNVEQPRCTLYMQRVCLMAEKSWIFKGCPGTNLFKEPLFWRGSEQTCPSLVWNPSPHRETVCHTNVLPKTALEKAASASGHKMCRNARNPWKLFSKNCFWYRKCSFAEKWVCLSVINQTSFTKVDKIS